MPSTKSSIFYQTYPFETSLIDVKEYFLHYSSALNVNDVVQNGSSKRKPGKIKFYSQVLGISPEEVEELNEATSVDNLTCPGEIEPMDYKLYETDSDFQMKYEMANSSKPEKYDLLSVKKRMELKADMFSHYNMKYGQYVWFASEEHPDVSEDLNSFDFSTVVFCIKVYYPYLSYSNHGHKVKLLQEIHVLGDQFLSDVKDKILCNMDYSGMTDVSNCLPKTRTTVAKEEQYSSSFIFIENQFFNDTRSSDLRDLSKTIIDWSKGKTLGPFTKKSMENTKLMDLKLRIGHPYVYQHQGDCEHILIISDIRFLQHDDPLKKCCFPRIYAKGRCFGRYCMMCGVAYAMWFVTENKRLTHDKGYFCNNCFLSYNYIDGQKIGNFKAYEYIDPIVLM